MRDSQKNRVYWAEHEAGFKETEERELPTLQHCQTFIQSVLNNCWVRMDFDEDVCRSLALRIRVVQTRKRSWCTAHYATCTIQMPTRAWAWQKEVLMHELAHHITNELWPPSPYYRGFTHKVAAHGPEFCWVYLRLLKHCGLPNEWALMKSLFVQHRVKFYQESPLAKAACRRV